MAFKKTDQDWRPPPLAKYGSNTAKLPPSQRTLERGWWAAITLKPGAASDRCYIGQIQAFDERGLRMTLVDWIAGGGSWDLYVPHNMIENMLLATDHTDHHFLDHLADEFAKWQMQVNSRRNG